MQNPFNTYRNLRLFVVCFAALAASLPMAWVSLSKVLLFTVSLGYLLTCFFKASDPFAPPPLFSQTVHHDVQHTLFSFERRQQKFADNINRQRRSLPLDLGVDPSGIRLANIRGKITVHFGIQTAQ